jgi:histidinol-phosphate aminotransferase
MNKYIPEKINKLTEYVPNLRICEVVLDANESPYDLPDDLKEEICNRIKTTKVNRYPDSFASSLIKAYAENYNIRSANIIAGNGSDELISLIITGFVSPSDTIITADPDFSMYNFYASMVGADVNIYEKRANDCTDIEEITREINEKKARLFIFSNPCNPTGKSYDRDAILKMAQNTDALIIVDEAYEEFSEKDNSLIKCCDKYDNLIVLRTLSKAYGLAGIRLGFAVANDEIIRALYKIKSPYNTDSISQLFGEIVLSKPEIMKANVKNIIAEKIRVQNELSQIFEKTNLQVNDTDTNFLYVSNNDKEKSEIINDFLLSKSIKIRILGCSLRITIGKPEENDRLISAMKEICSRL